MKVATLSEEFILRFFKVYDYVLCRSILSFFVLNPRGEIESVTLERNRLKESVNKFGVDSSMLIRESEEQTKQVEQQYERKLE